MSIYKAKPDCLTFNDTSLVRWISVTQTRNSPNLDHFNSVATDLIMGSLTTASSTVNF